MIGVLVNVFAIVLGSAIGFPIKKGMPERFSKCIMTAISLCIIYTGISGSLKGENSLVIIISMVLGALLGELLDIDKGYNKMSQKLEEKFSNGEKSFSKGFISASLIFCIGAMAVVGPLQAGLSENNEMLFSKSVMDFSIAVVLASGFGFFPVAFSAVSVLVYQGAIALLSGVVSPLFTQSVINEMTCVGSILIIGLGLNTLNITKIKLMNFIPAIFMPIVLCLIIK